MIPEPTDNLELIEDIFLPCNLMTHIQVGNGCQSLPFPTLQCFFSNPLSCLLTFTLSVLLATSHTYSFLF